MDATDVAMFVAGELAEVEPRPAIEQYRVDPPVLELLKDDVGIPFEAWTCFYNPDKRTAISFDPALRKFVLTVDGKVERYFLSLKAVFGSKADRADAALVEQELAELPRQLGVFSKGLRGPTKK